MRDALLGGELSGGVWEPLCVRENMVLYHNANESIKFEFRLDETLLCSDYLYSIHWYLTLRFHESRDSLMHIIEQREVCQVVNYSINFYQV